MPSSTTDSSSGAIDDECSTPENGSTVCFSSNTLPVVTIETAPSRSNGSSTPNRFRFPAEKHADNVVDDCHNNNTDDDEEDSIVFEGEENNRQRKKRAASVYFYHTSCVDSSSDDDELPVPKHEDEHAKQHHELSDIERLMSRQSCFAKDTVQDALIDTLFHVFCGGTGHATPHSTQEVPIGRLMKALEACGLKRSDPRLAGFCRRLARVERQLINTGQDLTLDRSTFGTVVQDNVLLLTQVAQNEFIIADFKTFCTKLEEIFEKCRHVTGGKCADYIPQLARADPTKWAMSACTVDGQRFSCGDSEDVFCLQAAGKPLIYGIALEEYGLDYVHSWVGKEPSGRHFNEIVLDSEKKPHNPMINAGSIVLASMLKPELTLADRFDFLHNYHRNLAGSEFIGYCNATFLSERASADRNFALGYFMKENGCFPSGSANLMTIMDLYFQMCSVQVTTESASVIAATLANGGVCPITNEKVLSSESVSRVLSLMFTCGMNDFSGQFAFFCGLPAKSGISGVIMLVVPNKLGIAVYNPLVDKFGNSVKGVAFCKQLVETFNFHNFDSGRFYSTKKMDPTARRAEQLGLKTVSLLFAASIGDMSTLRRLLMTGVDMAQTDYDGRTALHVAASEGLLEVVKFLVEKCNATRDVRDRWENTPLEDAIKFGHAQVAEYLAGVDGKQGVLRGDRSNSNIISIIQSIMQGSASQRSGSVTSA